MIAPEPRRQSGKAAADAPGLASAQFVGVGFLAHQYVEHGACRAMRAAQQFAAELIVGMRPGEGFQRLGRSRSGVEDPGDDAIIQMAGNRDDFGRAGRSRSEGY